MVMGTWKKMQCPFPLSDNDAKGGAGTWVRVAFYVVCKGTLGTVPPIVETDRGDVKVET